MTKNVKGLWTWLVGGWATLSAFNVIAHQSELIDLAASIQVVVGWWRAFTGLLFAWLPFHIPPLIRDVIVLTVWAVGLAHRHMVAATGEGYFKAALRDLLDPEWMMANDDSIPVADRWIATAISFIVGVTVLFLVGRVLPPGPKIVLVTSALLGAVPTDVVYPPHQGGWLGATLRWLHKPFSLFGALIATFYRSYGLVWVHRKAAMKGVAAVLALLVINYLLIGFGDPLAQWLTQLPEPPSFDEATPG